VYACARVVPSTSDPEAQAVNRPEGSVSAVSVSLRGTLIEGKVEPVKVKRARPGSSHRLSFLGPWMAPALFARLPRFFQISPGQVNRNTRTVVRTAAEGLRRAFFDIRQRPPATHPIPLSSSP